MLLGQNVKNGLINANFPIWQRNTSFNLNSAYGTYCADRHMIVAGADGGTLATGTISRQSLGAGEFEDQNYFMRITNTTQGSSLGTSSYHGIEYRKEDVRSYAGKRICISIWARSTIPNKAINFSGIQSFGSGGSSNVLFPGSQITVIDNTIRRYDIFLDVPSISGKIIGTSPMLVLGMMFQDGATRAALFGLNGISWQGTGNIDIIRWQVNEGGIADFETAGRFLQEEIQLCRRFYEKSYLLNEPVGTGSGSTGFYHSVAISAADFYDYGRVKFQENKRVPPAISIWSYTGAPGVLYNLSISNNQGNSGVRYQSENGFGVFCSNNQMTVTHAFAVHWAADAEL